MSSLTAYSLVGWLLSFGTMTSQEPNMVLSVPREVPLYQSQPVYIDCTARDSEFLRWKSSEYVGAEPVEVRATSPRITTAMGANISVIRASGEMLMSRLEFNVAMNVRNSSVTCMNIDQSREESINITSRDVNATLLRIASEKEKFCDGDVIEVECTAQSSSFVEWKVNGQLVSQCRSSELSNDGVLQTTCRHNISLSEGMHQVACRNVEVGVTNTTEILVEDSNACEGYKSKDDEEKNDDIVKANADYYSKASSIYYGGLIMGTLCAAAAIMTN